MITISIVVPIYNRIKLTQQGIQSLYEALSSYTDLGYTICQYSIVIVDDGSTDGSSEWIAENYPNIHVLKGDGNLWWTGAVNKGSRYAIEHIKSNFVILWNDDTLCDINYFIELDKILNCGESYENSILASKVYWLNEANTLFNYGCYYNPKTGKKEIIGLNQTDSQQYNKIIPIDWSGGMGTIIPANILTELNYFDFSNFPQYHADIDFFLRASEKGYHAYAIPTLKIYNNRDSTGISKTNNFSDLKNLFLSNRSSHNIKHNFSFNRRHANTLFSWTYFAFRYAILTSKSLRAIVWP